VHSGPDITDWILAGAGLFTAIGTVGTVVVALRQIRRQEQRRLHVECRMAVASLSATRSVNLITLRATNTGPRPVKLTQAYVQTDDSRKIYSPPTDIGDKLPILLLDGESAEISWEQARLDQARVDEGFSNYLFAFFTDTMDNIFSAPYPGMKQVRQGPPWRRRTDWIPSKPA
jgi:hypothetical protein